MAEKRRRCRIADNEAIRCRGEEADLTPRTKKSIYEAHCHEFRKGVLNEEGNMNGRGKKTRTTLNNDRRRDKVEYDRTHFGEQGEVHSLYELDISSGLFI